MLELKDMLEFIKGRKAILWFSIISVLGVYGYRLVHFTIGIDTEMAIADYEANLNWIMGGGRFSGVLLRKILMPHEFNYFLAIFITILVLIAANVTFAFVLYKWGMRNTGALMVFLGLFLTFPTFAEIFYFAGASYSIAIGILLSILSAHFISEWVHFERSLKYLLLGSGLGVFIVGLYQAFLFLIIAEIVALFILKIEVGKTTEKISVFFKIGMKLIAGIIVIIACYFLLSKVCTLFLYKEELPYAGYTNAQDYISGQVLWFNGMFGQGLANIVAYIGESLQWDNIFGSCCMMVLFVLNLVVAMIRAIGGKRLKYVYNIVLLLALFITPYLGAIMKGNAISAREQIILPFVLAFMGAYTLNYCIKQRILKRIFGIGMFYLAWLEMLATVGLFQTDAMRYQKDVAMAEQIIYAVEEKGGSCREKVIVFVGGRECELPNQFLTGEVIGGSFFNWDRYAEWGVNYRVFYFLKSIGMEYCMPDSDDILLGNTLGAEMDVWPAADSIKIQDEIVVVKLSE